MAYRIRMLWDNEACVWIATSEDIPGLVLESGSFDNLISKVKAAVPELIQLNGQSSAEYSLNYYSDRTDKVAVYG